MLSADLIPGGKLNAACKIHDKDYGIKGHSKAKADLKFLGNGLKQNWWNPYGWLKAFIYYGAVALGGKDAYKSAQEKVT